MNRLALKLFWRDWRSGELSILLVALVVAVSTMTSIGLFTDRVQNSIVEEASHLLAADAQIRGHSEFPSGWAEHAENMQLNVAYTTAFRAMVFANDDMQLASVKAVSSNYPLKGEVIVKNGGDTNSPSEGHVWLGARLMSSIGVGVGDTVEIGNGRFIVEAELIREPDVGMGALFGGARVLMHENDIDATGAVQFGSRVRYRMLLAGSSMDAFRSWVEPQLGEHFRWVGVNDSGQSMEGALDRAQKFLLLAGSLSVVLAGIAVSLAARRYALRQKKVVALVKTLGVKPKDILRLYTIVLVVLGFLGSLLGVFVGWCLHWIIMFMLQNYLPETIASPTSHAYVFGVAAGVLALFSFAAPPLLALRKTLPVAVMRETLKTGTLSVVQSSVLGLLGMVLLVAFYCQSITLTAAVTGAVLGVALAVSIVAWGVVKLAYLVSRKRQGFWRLGLANLYRHRQYNIFQLMIFAILFVLLFTLILIRTTLIGAWEGQIDDTAPNHFLYNIYDDDKPALIELLRNEGIGERPFYPMILGRIVSVNHVPLQQRILPDKRRTNYERELNLTWSPTLGGDNKIIVGKWWTDADSNRRLVSVEQQYAEGVGIILGDELQMSVAGETFTATVASIREVKWDSMNPNFYLIFNQPILDGVGSHWLTSFYLPDDKKTLLNRILKQYPTMTLVELDQMLAQIKSVIRQVSLAIEFILGLVLVSGFLVLVTGVQATLDERLKESAVLRALGGRQSLVMKSLWVEFGMLGGLSSVLAMLFSFAVVGYLQVAVFELPLSVNISLAIAAPFVGVLLIGGVGWLATRHVVRVSPLQVLNGLRASL